MTSWQFYDKTEHAWDAMLAECNAAISSIDLEQYIFLNDDIGKRFFEVLKRKASEGLRVRVLVDAAGSFSVYLSKLADELKKSGIQFAFFNPFPTRALRDLVSWFFRDHRKLLVVDSKVAYTGGVCLQADMSSWRDTHVRIEGPIVQEMSYTFERMWQGSRWRRYLRMRKPRLTEDGFGFYTNSPHFRQRFFYRTLIDAIRSAKRYAYFTTPYFIPDRRFFRVVRLAAQRGVDVRILTVQKSDHNLIDIASNYYFENALRRGIRIYQYQTDMLHAKSAVIDDVWATVGSANIDNWSFVLNHEANIVSTDKTFAGQVKDLFLKDLTASSEVNLAEWQKRPLKQKLYERLSWPLHKFM